MIRCQERAKVARKRTWGLSTILGRNSILNIFRVRGSRWKSKMTRTPSGRSSYALIGKKYPNLFDYSLRGFPKKLYLFRDKTTNQERGRNILRA